MELNIGDKVYKFYNGKYNSGICLVVEKDDQGYGIIPTECKINGEYPTVENTKPERFNKDGEAMALGYGRISIHKATPELSAKVGAYNTRMLLIDKICEELCVGYRNKDAVSGKLLTRTTKQLLAIFIMLFDKADGKRGICGINADGKLENDFFIPEELVNEVREPK